MEEIQASTLRRKKQRNENAKKKEGGWWLYGWRARRRLPYFRPGGHCLSHKTQRTYKDKEERKARSPRIHSHLSTLFIVRFLPVVRLLPNLAGLWRSLQSPERSRKRRRAKQPWEEEERHWLSGRSLGSVAGTSDAKQTNGGGKRGERGLIVRLLLTPLSGRANWTGAIVLVVSLSNGPLFEARRQKSLCIIYIVMYGVTCLDTSKTQVYICVCVKGTSCNPLRIGDNNNKLNKESGHSYLLL